MGWGCGFVAGLLPEKERERHREEGSKTERVGEGRRKAGLVIWFIIYQPTSFHLLFLLHAWAHKFLSSCGSQRAMWVFLNVL